MRLLLTHSGKLDFLYVYVIFLFLCNVKQFHPPLVLLNNMNPAPFLWLLWKLNRIPTLLTIKPQFLLVAFLCVAVCDPFLWGFPHNRLASTCYSSLGHSWLYQYWRVLLLGVHFKRFLPTDGCCSEKDKMSTIWEVQKLLSDLNPMFIHYKVTGHCFLFSLSLLPNHCSFPCLAVITLPNNVPCLSFSVIIWNLEGNALFDSAVFNLLRSSEWILKPYTICNNKILVLSSQSVPSNEKLKNKENKVALIGCSETSYCPNICEKCSIISGIMYSQGYVLL